MENMKNRSSYPDCVATYSTKFTLMKRRRPYDGSDYKGTGTVHCDSCELRKIMPPVKGEDISVLRESLEATAETIIYKHCGLIKWEEELKNYYVTDIPQSDSDV